MIEKPHESLKYQEFLTSDYRESAVPPAVYLDQLKDEERMNFNILDFGSGLGYLSVLLGNEFKNRNGVRIYAAEYQEDLIDLFWKRLVTYKLKNVTPFYIPDRSHINLPNWVPMIDHCFFSFSLSTVDDPFKVFGTIKHRLSETAVLHIVDWDHDSNNPRLETMFPQQDRLTLMILQQWLELTGYKVTVKDSKKGRDYFYLQAELFAP